MEVPEPSRFDPEEASYSCELHRDERLAEIRLAGELDLAARPRLDAVLRDAVDGDRSVDALFVDLTGVSFADSSTLHWLTEVKRHADAAGARLTVATAPGAVRDLLALTGMKPHLSV